MRLIDADKFFMKAYNVAYPVIHGNNDRENGLTMYGIAQLLDEQPTIDAVPVRHGHWEYIGGYGYQYRCSNCILCVEYKTNFCPHCGAVMDEATK